ncbi:phage baseplate assembly protein V [Psychrobacter sp. 72-O-c]|uniref:phage baseplate assembly protein V n=1 Tax=Psychrobacter sp. 72-O-c TaxID=2774125 RepID=UPI001918FAD3|nr:phage baseplate assembly protein V [Psychrobacter sp. 72-O-c]
MNAESQRRLHNIATIGTVTHIDADSALMRLAVGDNETDWINIPSIAAGQVSVWRCPSIGEQYLLVSPSGELANAIPVISLYSDHNPSPSTDPNEIRIRYNDTDFCSIDVANSQLTMHISQITNQAATSMVLDTPNTVLTGDLQVDGAINCSKTITASTEVTAAGIDLTTHTHSGVQSGGSSTGTPQ